MAGERLTRGPALSVATRISTAESTQHYQDKRCDMWRRDKSGSGYTVGTSGGGGGGGGGSGGACACACSLACSSLATCCSAPLAQPLHLRHVMHEAVSMGRLECECEKVRA